MFIVGGVPSSTVGILPDSLLDEPEVGVGVGLVDTAANGVRHWY